MLKKVSSEMPSYRGDIARDSKQGAVGYYLDREVRFNTQAAFLGRPSDEVVQKLARQMTLTVDPNAPTKLSEEDSRKLAKSKRVMQLSHESRTLTLKLREKYRFVRKAPRNEPWLKEKKKVDAMLHRAKTNRRNRMLDKARKRYFRNADTAILEAQFADDSITAPEEDIAPAEPLQYNIPERGFVVQMTCESPAAMTNHEKHVRRLEAIKARAMLCGRQESRRRGRPKHVFPKEADDLEVVSDMCDEDREDLFPIICKPTQCTFCLGNEAKSYGERMFEYCRPSKMMDHVEDAHLSSYAPRDEVPCKHPQCALSKVILPGVMAFKNHTASVHKVLLRVCK
ncbi:MAG: hypothetical protein Q9187_002066 [Circinaria calcarea]